MEKITFDNLPQMVDCLLTEVRLISNALQLIIKKPPDEDQEFLNLSETVEFFLSKKILMSKSKLHKLTSDHKIPHRKVQNKLIFNRKELIQWFEDQLINPIQNQENYTLSLIQSSIKKNNHEKK